MPILHPGVFNHRSVKTLPEFTKLEATRIERLQLLRRLTGAEHCITCDSVEQLSIREMSARSHIPIPQLYGLIYEEAPPLTDNAILALSRVIGYPLGDTRREIAAVCRVR